MTPDHKQDDVPWETLAAFLAGELSESERAQVESWIASDSRHEELLALLRGVWDTSAANRRRYNVEEALGRIKQTTPSRWSSREPPRTERQFVWATGARPLVRVLLAASIVAFLFGGWWATSRFVARLPADGSLQIATREYRTPRGQRLAFKLADGSSVLLGPASVLRVDSTYGLGGRLVELTGEAYFEVTHDIARPFVVRTTWAVARDLGTRFIVRAFAEEAVTDVVVAEGKLALDARAPERPSRDSLVLEPGHRGRVTRKGELVHTPQVNLDSYLAWTEGRLVFRDTPLPEALRQLGRWYDIDVRVADPNARGRTVTASFRDEPAPEAIRLVALSLGLRVERDGAAFVLASVAR